MIQVHGLRKAFGSNVAVDDISFEIRKGELFGLLGPNGAGKSTTINLMVGALSLDAGDIRIGGASDPTRAVVRRKIGLAPQALALYEELSAEENLAFYGRLYGLRGASLRERVTWCLDLAGLADRRSHLIKNFSGGMKRRINLACALVHEPEVLFLDEPTVGVDPQSRSHVFESLETLHKAGLTILYTTHYMEEAQRLCDRVAIMDHGKILALDRVDELIRNHGGASILTAELERPPADPGALPGTLEGTTLRLQTQTPLEDLARLSASGAAFTTLKIERPDLEVVFLKLTGRRLRD